MKPLLQRFANEEFGAALLDWTVFATGAVLLSVAVLATMIEAWF